MMENLVRGVAEELQEMLELIGAEKEKPKHLLRPFGVQKHRHFV